MVVDVISPIINYLSKKEKKNSPIIKHKYFLMLLIVIFLLPHWDLLQ